MAAGTSAPLPSNPPPGGSRSNASGRFIEYDRYIEAQIRRTRRQVKGIDLAASLMLLAAGSLVYFLLAALVDHWLIPGGLGFAGRLACLTLYLGGVLAFAALKLAPLLLRRINPVYAAQAIERNRPGLKNSLVNFLLLRTREAELPQSIYEAIEEQAATGLSAVNVETAIDRTPLIKLMMLLMALTSVAALYGVLSPKNPFTSFRRVIDPWAEISAPTRVKIAEIQPGDADGYHDQHLNVTALVSGLSSGETATVHYSTADGQTVDQRVRMSLPESGYRFTAELPSDAAGLQQDMIYWITAGDAISPRHRIAVHTVPSIVVDALEYNYPAYSEISPRSVPKHGNIQALEGTRVTIRATASHEIRSADLDFDCDGRRDLAMKIDGRKASVEFPLTLKAGTDQPEHESYQLRFRNLQGHENPKPIRYTIEVIRDLPPEIALVEPQLQPTEEYSLTAGESLPLVLTASDPDYQLADVRLHVRRGRETLLAEPLLSEARSGSYRRRFVFATRQFKLKPGETLSLWASADDNRQPEANHVETPHYTLRVVSPDGREESDQLADAKSNKQRKPDDPENGDAKDNQQRAPRRPGEQMQPNDPKQPGEPTPDGDEPNADNKQKPDSRNPRDPKPSGKEQGSGEQPNEGKGGEKPNGGKSSKENSPEKRPDEDDSSDAERRGEDSSNDGAAEGKSQNSRGEKGSSERVDPEKDAGRAIDEINKFFDKKQPEKKPSDPKEPGKKQPGKKQPDEKQPDDGQGDQGQDDKQPSDAPQDQSQGEKMKGDKTKGEETKGDKRKETEQESSGGEKGDSASGEKQQGGKAKSQGKQTDGGQKGKKGEQGEKGEGQEEQNPAGSDESGADQKSGGQKSGSGKSGEKKAGQRQRGEGQQGDESGEKMQSDDPARGAGDPEKLPAGKEPSEEAKQGRQPKGEQGPEGAKGKQEEKGEEGAKGRPKSKGESADEQGNEPNAGKDAQKGDADGMNGDDKPGEKDQAGDGRKPSGKKNAGEEQPSGGEKAGGEGGEKEPKKADGSKPDGGKAGNSSDENKTPQQSGDAGGNGQKRPMKEEDGEKRKPGEPSPEGDDASKDAQGEKRPQPGKGGRTKGQGDPEKNPNGDKKDPNQDVEGGDPEGEDRVKGGAGKPGGNKSPVPSPNDGKNKPKEKKQTSDDKGLANTDEEGNSGSVDDKQSDSKSDKSGEHSGGGGQGGGQRAKSPGKGAAGQSSDAEQGGGQSEQTGEGPTGEKGGDQQEGSQRSGGASSGKKGPGSTKKQGGSKPGEGDAPGEQAGGNKDGKENGQDNKQPGGEQGEDQAGGQPSPSEKGGHRLDGKSPTSTRNNPTGGDVPESDNPDEPKAPSDTSEPGGEDPNLDYTRKATNLALERLKDQLDKGEPDQELLDKLKWSRKDVEQFVERWEQLKKSAKSAGPEGDAAREQLDETLRSLGLRPHGTTLSGGEKRGDQRRDLIESRRSAPPPEYAEQYREFSKGLLKGRK